MKPDIGDVLRRMWSIGWNHKVLWLYQLLPGLSSMVLLPFFILLNPAAALFLPAPWNRLAEEPWVIGLSMAGMSLLTLPIMFVATAAQLATTHGALKAERGAQQLGFRDTLTDSLPYFWRVVGLYTIFGGAWMLIIFAYMAATAAASILTFGLASICLTPFFFLLVPVAILGYAVMELAQAAIIADDMKVTDAISHGWRLFRANMLAVILLMVILYVGLSTISSVFILPMMLPMMFLPLGLGPGGDLGAVVLVSSLALFVLLFALMLVVQAILMAFFQTAWAVAYLRLNPGPAPDAVVLSNS
jgi:hypothetical protein